jgi:hypothetical protein
LTNYEILYIFEIKGEIYVGQSREKIELLKKLDESKDAKVKTLFITDTVIDTRLSDSIDTFKDVAALNELFKI